MSCCMQFDGESCHFDEGMAGSTPPSRSVGRSPYTTMGGYFPLMGTSPLDGALDMMVKREVRGVLVRCREM